MKHIYKTKGICATSIEIELNDKKIIKNVKFNGGCQGNTKGIEKLVKGLDASIVIEKFKGIDCQGRGTSCPDQLAKGLKEALNLCDKSLISR